MAAVLACVDGALLSHRSAATLQELLNVRGGLIEVTILRHSSLARPGLRVHRSTCLVPHDCVTVDRIPCTSVSATLLGLAATAPTNVLESACNKAEIKGLASNGRAAHPAQRERAQQREQAGQAEQARPGVPPSHAS